MLITVASEAIEKGGGRFIRILKKKDYGYGSPMSNFAFKKRGGAKPPPPGSDAYGNSVTIQR